MRAARHLVACVVFVACGSDGADESARSAPSDAGAEGAASSSSGGSSSGGSSGVPGQDGAVSGPPTTPSPGTTTGASLFVQANLIISSEAVASDAKTHAIVQVQASGSGTALAGATVSVTPYGGRTEALVEETSVVGVRYTGTFNQPAAVSYELGVVHATGTRTGIVVLAPSVFKASVTPPPQENTVSTVTWLPNNEAEVGAYIIAGSYATPGGAPLPDSGAFDLPATAFTFGQPAIVTVQRARPFTVTGQVGARVVVNEIVQSAAVKP